MVPPHSPAAKSSAIVFARILAQLRKASGTLHAKITGAGTLFCHLCLGSYRVVVASLSKATLKMQDHYMHVVSTWFCMSVPSDILQCE